MQNVEEMKKRSPRRCSNEKPKIGCSYCSCANTCRRRLCSLKNGAPSEQCAAIKANQNVIINIGAATSGLTDERFRSIIEAAVAGNFQIAKDE